MPTINFDPTAPKITVGTASVQPHQSSGAADLDIPNLTPDFPRAGKVMPYFHHTLICIAPIYDVECKVTFTKQNVIIYDQEGSPILTGWRERTGASLWRIALTPTPEELPTMPNSLDYTNLKAYSAYDLPSVEALVRYFHAAAGFPVSTTWPKAIKMGIYRTWPGLTLANATVY